MADLLLGVKIGVEGGPQTVKQVKAIDDEVKKLQDRNKRVAETAKALSEAYDLSDAEIKALVNELGRLEDQTEAAARQAAAAEEAFNNLSATEKAIKRLQDALEPERNAARLLSSLQDIERTSDSVEDAAQRLRTAFKLEPDNALRLARALDNLKDETGDAADAARQLGRELNLDDNEIDALTRQIRKLRGEINDTSDSANRLGDIFTGIAQGAGQQLTELAVESIQRLGEALRDTAAQALEVSAQYDAASAAVKTLGVDGAALGDEMQTLSRRLGNQANAVELLQGSYDIVSAGFSDISDVSQIVEASVQGAVGGFSDFATVSDAATSVLNAYGKSADEVNDIVDKFIATQNAGKITVNQYAQQIGQLAPTAALAGVGIDELNGFIATATAQGVPVGSTFAGIRQAIAAILKPSSDAAKYAEELGVGFDAATLNAIGLEGILTQLNEKGADSADSLLRLFGSTEAVAAIAPSAGANIDVLRRNIDLSRESAGAAAQAFNDVAASIPQLQVALDNKLTDGFLRLGQAIDPIKVGILSFASDLITATTESSAGLGQLEESAKRLGDVLRLNPELAQKLGEAFAGVADTAIEQLALLLDAVTAFVSEEGNIDAIAASLENVSFTLTKLGQGARFVIALVDSLLQVKTAIQETAESSRLGRAAFGFYSKQLDLLFNPLKRLDAFLNFLKGTWETVNNVIGNTRELLAALLTRFDVLARNPIVRALVNQLVQVDAAAAGVGSTITEGLGGSIEGVEQLGTQAAESIAEANASIGETASETAGAVEDVEDAKSALETLIDENKASLNQIAIDTANAKAELLESGGGQDELAALEQEGLNQRINNNKEFLKQLNALKTGGTITDPDELQKLSDQILQVESTLASDRVNLAQQVARAQQQLIEDTARRELTALDTVADRRKADFDEQKRLLDEEKTLLTEQANLTQANNDLERERLETALARAEATGDEVAQERIRRQLIDLNERSIQQQFEAKQRSLEIETRLAEIEAQRSVVLAEIAVREARINLTRARGTDATAEEIENLEAILGLEQEGLDAARDSQGFVDEINDIKADQLDIEQEIAKEVQNQAEIENKNLEVNRKIEQAKKRQADAAKAATEAFNEQQQAEADAFREQQRRESEEFNRGLSALEREVQRRLQLEQATGEERARLTEQFKQEDEELVRRFELERQVLRERGSILGRLPDEVLNLSPLQAERAAFEQSQQEAQAVFDQQQQEAKAAFEEGLRQQEEAFEQRLRDEAFAALQAEQASASAFQQSQLTERATFNQGQRELDVANARQIASILQGVEPAPIEARRDGGAVLPGRSYLVGEEGPELITPGRRGWVQTAAQTAALLSGGAPRINGLPGHTGGIERKLDTLIGAVVANRRVSMAPSSYTLNSVNPIQDAVELQLQTIRRLTRMRGI